MDPAGEAVGPRWLLDQCLRFYLSGFNWEDESGTTCGLTRLSLAQILTGFGILCHIKAQMIYFGFLSSVNMGTNTVNLLQSILTFRIPGVCRPINDDNKDYLFT